MFVDEPPRPVEAAGNATNPQHAIAGLDTDGSAFLLYLSARQVWPREELERAASERSLLLDGTIEAINDAAFAACDEAVLEGDDPVEINAAAMAKLMERTHIQ